MTPESGSLVAACAIAFGGALIGGGLQLAVLHSAKGDLGAGAGLPLSLGLLTAVSLGVAVMMADTGPHLGTVVASHLLGWAALWLWSRRKSKPRG
jgi:hypothetical protein